MWESKRLSTEVLMLSNGGAGEDSWESFGLKGDPTSPSQRKSTLNQRKSTLNLHWKDWCWSSNTLATYFEELTHWKRPWHWERLRAGGEVGGRGWNGWMASPIQWTWVWANSRRWGRTRKPGVPQSTGSQGRTQLSDWTTTIWPNFMWKSKQWQYYGWYRWGAWNTGKESIVII